MTKAQALQFLFDLSPILSLLREHYGFIDPSPSSWALSPLSGSECLLRAETKMDTWVGAACVSESLLHTSSCHGASATNGRNKVKANEVLFLPLYSIPPSLSLSLLLSLYFFFLSPLSILLFLLCSGPVQLGLWPPWCCSVHSFRVHAKPKSLSIALHQTLPLSLWKYFNQCQWIKPCKKLTQSPFHKNTLQILIQVVLDQLHQISVLPSQGLKDP